MRDQNDRATGDLLRSPVATRQAAYADRQRALGRRQRVFWLTGPEIEAVKELISRLREDSQE